MSEELHPFHLTRETHSMGKTLVTGLFPGEKWQTWLVAPKKKEDDPEARMLREWPDEDAAFLGHELQSREVFEKRR
jgi:hypothetical protein